MSTTDSAALTAFFAHYYARNPVNATFTGVHSFDGELPNWSRAARSAEAVEMRTLHAELSRAHPLPAGGVSESRDAPLALDAELARANLDVRIAEYESGFFHDRNPALWTGEAIFGAVSLMIREFAPAAERLPSLTARLAAVPTFLQSMRDTISQPVPERWRDRAVRECDAAAALFGDGLDGWLAVSFPRHEVASDSSAARRDESEVSDVSDGRREQFDALRTSAHAARTAFAECRSRLEVMPVASDDAYSAGEKLLGTLLSRGHFCTESPRTLLVRAEAAMMKEQRLLAEALAQHGTDWTGALATMAADRPAASAYYGAFARRWEQIRAGVLARDAVTWPQWPIRYVPIPKWARNAAPALYWLFYRSPAPFDEFRVHEYVVMPVDDTIPADEQQRRLALWNNSVITLNHVVHHGGVGHHVQNWHAVHRSSSRVGTIAAVDCASRIGMFLGGSMAEGWACYATALADELGLLSPLESLSEQHTRVRQLARAIVDLRLHLGDWSVSECERYHALHTGMSAEAAAAETTKNSMFPGTALMYWLGTQGILDLRARVRQTRGEAFSLREFHDELLGRGSTPVPLVTVLMTDGASMNEGASG
ncbi:MAG: DUF885 family protein [Gemmatimonas sp.]